MHGVDVRSSLESQEFIARKVREDERPFGGIQVVFWLPCFFCFTENYPQSSSFAETSSSYPLFQRNSRLFSSLSRRTRGLGVLGLLSPFTGSFAKITKVKKATYNAHDALFTFRRVHRHA